MLTGLSSVLALSILVPSASADKLSELEQKQQEAQQQQSQLNSGINEKTEKINVIVSKLEKLAAKIEELNNKISETEAKIDSVQTEIDQTKAEIDELRKSIEELERKIAEREELLKERARAIQLSGGSVDYIDVLLGANNFVDFIDRFSAVNTLIEADREIMREQAEDKKLLAEQKAQVESKLAGQEVRRAELVELKDSLDGQKKEQASLVKDLEAEQKRLASEKEKLIEKRSEAINVSKKLENEIVKEQKRLAEIARKAEEELQRKLAAEKVAKQKEAAAARQAEASKTQRKEKSSSAAQSTSSPAYSVPASSGKSPFIRPTTGQVTSNFGWRDIGAGPEFTSGMDIANSIGTNVAAAGSGYVSHAGVMGGLGNAVVITHSIGGQTYTTVYGHLNSIDVSTGQKVSQGQRIGAMGNTGRSTGPHLHFEVHMGIWDGSSSNAVDPAKYIGY